MEIGRIIVNIIAALIVILLIYLTRRLNTYNFQVEETYRELEQVLFNRIHAFKRFINKKNALEANEKKLLSILENIQTSFNNPYLSREDHFDSHQELSNELATFMERNESSSAGENLEDYENFRQSMVDLEKELFIVRNNYNEAVKQYNEFLNSFPAALFNWRYQEYKKREF